MNQYERILTKKKQILMLFYLDLQSKDTMKLRKIFHLSSIYRLPQPHEMSNIKALKLIDLIERMENQ